MSVEERSEESQTITGNKPKPPSPDFSIIRVSTIAYALMGTAGALVSLYGHGNFWTATSLPPKDQWFSFISIAVLSSGILLIGGYLFEGWFTSYRAIKRAILHLLGPTSWYTGIYLALVSAIGEEFLFRAALLPYTGLLISSIIFGLVHIGPEGGLSTWTIWAFCAGLLLGWMFEVTGTIWPSIVCHFIVNAFSLLRIQIEFRRHPFHDRSKGG